MTTNNADHVDASQVIVEDKSVPLSQKWLWRPNMIVFISSTCIMILELVAERIVAPHIGSSLYTWTSIIGVVLAGISLGNFIGGQMADRRASLHLLGRMFLLSGLTCLNVLFMNSFDLAFISQWPIIAQSLVLIATLFFLPALTLGTVSPIVAKLAVQDLTKSGRIVGRIYASGSVGSIFGTLITGFFLNFLFDTQTIIWGVSGLLLLMGLLFLLNRKPPVKRGKPAEKPVDVPNSWLWQPILLVFLASASMMTLELVVGRLTAPYVGVSTYTWTLVIGVVLAGISVGNTLGGWMADRWNSPHLLGRIFILSGFAALSMLAVVLLQTFTDIENIISENVSLLAILVLFVIILTFGPCVVLGSISPIVAKLAVRDLEKTGSTVGQIYAAGAAGSIVGTFITGFFLISWLGTYTVIWGTGMVLLGLGLLLLLGRRWPWLLVSFLLLVAGTTAAVRLNWLKGPCSSETNYYCIRVLEDERDGERVYKLILDRLVHSYTFVEYPTKLVYEYEKFYAEATAYQAQDKEHLNALFIGGGGYTFPRYMEALYPDSDLHVIEIDPGVTEIAHQILGLSRDTHIMTYNEDARMFLKREPTMSYDLIFGDAFNDYSVPYHLTTREFNERVHTWLAEDGLYMVNLIDGPYGHFMRAYAHTLRQTFDHVYIVLDEQTWRLSPRSTIVFIASDTPLDIEALKFIDSGDGPPLLAQKLLPEDTFNALLDEGRTITLRDRFAPTDWMLLPVFLEQVPK